jgi:putative tricarboxylic transport membrane protein
MRRCHQIAGLILLLAALYLGHQSWLLPYYSSLGPGPGFFPIWLSGLLALLSIAMIAQATREAPARLPADFFPDSAGLARIACAIGGLFMTAALMSVFGFRATTFVFYVALLVAFGRRNVIEIIALSALGAFGVHYLFSHMLQQQLPAGAFDW